MNDKKEFEVLRPIGFKGERVERGTVLALTDEEVANIGAESLKAMDEVETPAEETAPETPAADETPADDTTPAETSEETPGDVEATEPTEEVPAAEATEETTEGAVETQE